MRDSGIEGKKILDLADQKEYWQSKTHI